MVSTIANSIINSEVNEVEEALKLNTNEGTVEELIVAKTAKLGEKLSFRRFVKLNKNDNEVFGTYIHMGGKIATLVLLEGSNEEVAKDVSMHAAAMKPLYVNRNEVTADVIEKEKEIIKEQAINEGKAPEIAEKMVLGRINKFYQEVCLDEQSFVKNGDITVGTYVKNSNGSIKAMYRFEVGEGMEKKEENFACEVMNQLKK